MRFPLIACGALVLLTGCPSPQSNSRSGGDSPPAKEAVRVWAGDGRLALFWDEVAGAASYQVYYSWTIDGTLAAGGALNLLGTLPSRITLGEGSPLTNGTMYAFKVVAVGASWTASGTAVPKANVTTANTPYERLHLDISAPSTAVAAWVNAHPYQMPGFSFLNGVSITVDGTPVVKQSYNNYAATLAKPWSTYATSFVAVTWPSGTSWTGSLARPTGLLSGVTYSPAKGDPVADTYTVTPPAGGWPSGSYVVCTVTQGTTVTDLPREPTGTDPYNAVLTSYPGITAVKFTAYRRTKLEPPGFAAGTYLSVTGTPTEW